MADKKEVLFDAELSADEYNEAQSSSKFVEIPPGPSGVMAEGDSIYLTVEAGQCEWKNPGKSLVCPLTVVDPGINEGKSVDWFFGISKEAMGITKKALKAFGIEDKVVRIIDGKVKIAPLGTVGARARGLFKREMTQNGHLIAKLDSTAFLPVEKAQ